MFLAAWLGLRLSGRIHETARFHHGAGAELRQPLGVAVVGGLLTFGKRAKGSGHWLMDEAPDQVIAKLVTFLPAEPPC
jgi:hypothetical protein